MIELFEDPRLDKPSTDPAPQTLVKFRQISQDVKESIEIFLLCHNSEYN